MAKKNGGNIRFIYCVHGETDIGLSNKWSNGSCDNPLPKQNKTKQNITKTKTYTPTHKTQKPTKYALNIQVFYVFCQSYPIYVR